MLHFFGMLHFVDIYLTSVNHSLRIFCHFVDIRSTRSGHLSHSLDISLDPFSEFVDMLVTSFDDRWEVPGQLGGPSIIGDL